MIHALGAALVVYVLGLPIASFFSPEAFSPIGTIAAWSIWVSLIAAFFEV